MSRTELAFLRDRTARPPSRMSVASVSDAAIGSVLRNARCRKGLSQADVGIEMRVAAVTIQHWEAGRSRVPPDRRAALAAFLGLAETDLRRADDIARTQQERILLARFRDASEDERRAALAAVCP